MALQDYDDPELFYQSVSGITLKAMPEGFLSDCLGEGNLDITIVPNSKGVVGPGSKPWLDIFELDSISWSKNIKIAHLSSDCLQESGGLYCIPDVKELTVTINGSNYDVRDMNIFWDAIQESKDIKNLSLIVDLEEVAQSQDFFVWPRRDFSVEITPSTSSSRSKLRRRRSGEV